MGAQRRRRHSGAGRAARGLLRAVSRLATARRARLCSWPENFILSGSSTLTSTLLEHGLADEVLLVVYPVLLGTGKRFFAEGTLPRSFEFVSTKALASGVILNTYKPNWPLQTGTTGA